MIVQAWVGISAFRCLRAMGDLPVPGMVNDGFLWFKDLTVADPYYVLPAAITGIFYAIFKVCSRCIISFNPSLIPHRWAAKLVSPPKLPVRAPCAKK
jgi:hypothetical protein